MLTSGRRTALPRHRTLRATLDWSHDLLLPDEAKVLRRLAEHLSGDQAAAVEHSGEARSQASDPDDRFRTALAQALAQLGEAETAAALLDEAIEQIGATDTFDRAGIFRARGVLCATAPSSDGVEAERLIKIRDRRSAAAIGARLGIAGDDRSGAALAPGRPHRRGSRSAGALLCPLHGRLRNSRSGGRARVARSAAGLRSGPVYGT